MAERVTFNLVPRSARALAKAMELTDYTKTDCVNHALPLYAHIEQALANGGHVTVQERPGDEPVQLLIL